ncbi:unnamed protein product [Soboliphyme baturini]|uniref:RRM domain-containing protein n=1 Tax=Soboliphyme baturini TaxID=241478 RepID=A0A183IJ36_9BILA|nr:unnamed protein product [Soboliphyme baturini]
MSSFAFVTFADEAAAKKALMEGTPHVLKGFKLVADQAFRKKIPPSRSADAQPSKNPHPQPFYEDQISKKMADINLKSRYSTAVNTALPPDCTSDQPAEDFLRNETPTGGNVETPRQQYWTPNAEATVLIPRQNIWLPFLNSSFAPVSHPVPDEQPERNLTSHELLVSCTIECQEVLNEVFSSYAQQLQTHCIDLMKTYTQYFFDTVEQEKIKRSVALLRSIYSNAVAARAAINSGNVASFNPNVSQWFPPAASSTTQKDIYRAPH